MVEVPTEVPCPVCDWNPMKFRSIELEIPFFGKANQTTIFCEKCEYKHNDIMLSELNEPTRYSFTIRGEEDMSVKVVRSASATVSIPALGLLVEPGVASEGYISTVEGVLIRFRDAVEQAIRFSAEGGEDESDEERSERKNSAEKGREILEAIEEVIGGKRSVDVIIEDPFGNSAIISDRAKKEALTEEEAAGLKTGFNILEVARQT